MTTHRFIGGLWDGHEMDVDDHCHSVSFPAITTPTQTGRSLADLEPEVRFDYETGAIVAPAELVLGVRHLVYRRICKDGDFEFYSDTPTP